MVQHTELSSWLCFAGITRTKLGRPFICGKRREGKVQIFTVLGPEGSGAHPALLDLSTAERPTARGHALEHSSLPEPSSQSGFLLDPVSAYFSDSTEAVHFSQGTQIFPTSSALTHIAHPSAWAVASSL